MTCENVNCLMTVSNLRRLHEAHNSLQRKFHEETSKTLDRDNEIRMLKFSVFTSNILL